MTALWRWGEIEGGEHSLDVLVWSVRCSVFGVRFFVLVLVLVLVSRGRESAGVRV